MPKALPAYQKIKQYILQSIHSGDWITGEVIPTEIALAEKFSVSRMTVNRALKELSEEKVLERRQGSGTFVAQQHFNHIFVEVRSVADDIRKAGKTYRSEVVHQSYCVLSDLPNSTQKLLNSLFQIKQKLFQLEIVHYADEVPIQYERRWVDTELVPEFAKQDFNHVNASDYLIKKIPLIKGNYFIQAKSLPLDIANTLKVKNTQPALVLTRYTYSKYESVATYVQMWHNGNEFQFSGML